MGRRIKYRTQEERQTARREQRLKRSSEPGFKETRRKENRKAYAKSKVVVVPEPSDDIQSLASIEISEDSLYKHLYAHHSITADPLKLPAITLTNADFQRMTGHPPYPTHVVHLDSFEKDWPQISAALHGYVTRMYVRDQTALVNKVASHDRASLYSKLSKLYRSLMVDWELFGNAVRDNANELPTEFLAFQSRLWISRRLTWLAQDLGCLADGVDVFVIALRDRLNHFQ